MRKKTLITLSLVLFCITGSYAQIAEKAEDISPLLIGETIPQDIAAAINTNKKNLATVLKDKPSVILFYRGGWCPYCNRHLSAIGEAEKAILELGYQVIGISPDTEKGLNASVRKNKLNYMLFSDADGKLAKAMGIAFKAPEKYKNLLLKSSNGENKGFLPVPSVFVVDTKGVILFEYVSPDYKERISAALLTGVLKALKP
ncbi:MAG: peroxiredoxin-like family protein [Bacteroidota bacterium]